MNRVTIEIDNCMDCKYSHQEQIYTPDSFDHEIGLYCSLCKSKEKMFGHITDDKLIVADDGDLRQWADIPDWCPRL